MLIAIGFSHPEHEGLVDQLAVDLDARGNVKAAVYETSVEGVFACGDARTGQSLVVTAIAERRKCARIVDRQLTGEAGRAREEVIVGALADEELHHLLREEAETAGTVVPGDTYYSPPR